jgi:hypothetical protein
VWRGRSFPLVTPWLFLSTPQRAYAVVHSTILSSIHLASSHTEMQGESYTSYMTKDIRKACNNCIKAKAACDHNRPCLRCVSHKIADSCANVPRKANKRRVLEDSHSTCPCQTSTTNNISCMLNTSLNNIINNLNNGNTHLTQHAHSGGEITGSNIINSAVQNLYSSNTSAIISNTISSLSDSMDTQIGIFYLAF